MKRWMLYVGSLVIVASLATWGYLTVRPDSPIVSAAPAAVTLTMDCGGVGLDFELCSELVQQFAARTGYTVIPKLTPQNATLRLHLLRELFLTRSTGMDVVMVDVIWPGMLADDLLDLTPYFNPAQLADFFPEMVANNTVNGQLLAVPWFTDAGLLYYRTDLLQRYGFNTLPTTWNDLAYMARVIQEGERAAGNEAFWGFVWQGRSSESLTCNALEWLASEGAGTIVEPDGRISVNNPASVQALARAQRWIGTISPPEVLAMGEEEARALWEAGNAAFMRNWPYAYALGQREGSAVRGRFDVMPLPQGAAGSAAALGGWQLAVSRHSRFPQQAVELVRFMTSAEAQEFRAIRGAYNPTRRSLYQDPDVLAANPFFARMPEILMAAVARPSTVTAAAYDSVSTAFQTEVFRVLQGAVSPEVALSALEQQLVRIRGEAW